MDPKIQNQTNSQQQAPIPDQVPPRPVECKKCKNPIADAFYFCPNCGNKIKEPPYKFNLSKAIGVILVSVIFPPLGLFPGFRYIRMKETGAKILGTAAIMITIFATIITLVIFKNYLDGVNKQLNDTNFMQTEINNPQGSVQDQVQQLQNQNH